MDFSESPAQAPNREELLQLAIRAARAGNKEPARAMFHRVWSEDKRNERAMMWLAKLADDKAERKQWLTRVLAVNPNNEIAKQALHKMQYRKSAKDNRTLLFFGVIAGILIVLMVVIFVVVFTAR
ncbi:MAG: hypothetical protein IAE80_08130 [Anaerolinea sp.]|nr:hypothetical protein [Anaerolinea sp.]